MADILVAYGSIEGHSQKIAHFLIDVLQTAKHEPTIFDCSSGHSLPFLNSFNKAILVGSIHRRRHPNFFEKFISKNKVALSRMPTLLISVSLCAAFAEGQSEALDYINEMGLRTDFSPDGILLVGGAIKFSKYHEYEAQVVKLIGLHLRKRDDVDNDRIFTDWIKLESDIKKFATEW
jgi:menaquinone-dependent protoporphyrinogen oxidase